MAAKRARAGRKGARSGPRIIRAESRSVALAVTDSSASRGGRLAPHCPPAVTAPREASWDPEGCWENRPDGSRAFRTAWGGNYYYHASPPAYSRYYASDSFSHSKWFSGWHSS